MTAMKFNTTLEMIQSHGPLYWNMDKNCLDWHNELGREVTRESEGGDMTYPLTMIRSKGRIARVDLKIDAFTGEMYIKTRSTFKDGKFPMTEENFQEIGDKILKFIEVSACHGYIVRTFGREVSEP